MRLPKRVRQLNVPLHFPAYLMLMLPSLKALPPLPSPLKLDRRVQRLEDLAQGQERHPLCLLPILPLCRINHLQSRVCHPLYHLNHRQSQVCHHLYQLNHHLRLPKQVRQLDVPLLSPTYSMLMLPSLKALSPLPSPLKLVPRVQRREGKDLVLDQERHPLHLLPILQLCRLNHRLSLV